MPSPVRNLTRLQTARWYTDALKAAARQRRSDQVLADLGRRDLWFLLVWLLRRKDIGGHDWLFDRCREVQASPDGHLDLWARGHFKTSMITFGLTLQDILRDPELTVGIFSHTRPIAKGFLRQIMRELEANEELKACYPEILWADPRRDAPKWSEDDGIIVKRASNPKESTIEAWGLVDGQPVSRHFKLRVYDDVVTEASVTTPEMVHKTTGALELSQNLGVEGGAARYIGTRYHLADTYHTLLERRSVKPRIYPATHNGRPDGKPVLMAQAAWDKLKRDQPTKYPAQMLQNPAGGNQAMFDPNWIKTWEIRPRTLNVYITVDPSLGKTKRSDRTAMVVTGIDSQGMKYLLDGARHRMNLGERWQLLRNLHKRWSKMAGVRTVSVGYERYGMQSDIEYFEERMKLEKYSFGIEEIAWPREGPQSKPHRVQRLVPDLEQGRLRLPAYCWTPDAPKSLWWIAGGEVNRRALNSETATERRAKSEGLTECIASPIRRVDEEGKLYDLTMAMVEEIMFFPFGTYDDLIDAQSRIYDLDPAVPQIVTPDLLEPKTYIDGA